MRERRRFACDLYSDFLPKDHKDPHNEVLTNCAGVAKSLAFDIPDELW